MEKNTRHISGSRLPYVDLLECLAIYFVLTYHGTLHDCNFLNNGSAVYYIRYFFNTILSTCVPLFMFINGYLLFRKPFDLKKHVQKIIRLVLVTCAWILILLVVMQPINGQHLTWEQIGTMFWELHMGWNNHLWYMGALVCIYIFFPLLKHAYDTNRKVFCYFVAISAVMTMGKTLLNEFVTVFNYVVLHKVEVIVNFNFFHIFNPFHYTVDFWFVYFCAGGILYSLQEKIEAIPARKRNVAALAGIAVCCTLQFCLGVGYSILSKQYWDVVYSGYGTVFTFGNVICLFVLALNWKKDVPLIRAISCNTLGIYLIHSVFHRLLVNWVPRVPQMFTLPGTLVYAVVLLAVCLIFCLIVKKIPVLKKLI